MKKVLVAVVLMMGIGSFSAFAAETSVDSVVIACEVNQDDFVKVEVKDLPGVVTQSIEKSYPDSVIQEVYVAEKTEGKLYLYEKTNTTNKLLYDDYYQGDF